jgi:hypothetical protein
MAADDSRQTKGREWDTTPPPTYKIEFFAGKNVEDFVTLVNSWFKYNRAIKDVSIHCLSETKAYILYYDSDDGLYDKSNW